MSFTILRRSLSAERTQCPLSGMHVERVISHKAGICISTATTMRSSASAIAVETTDKLTDPQIVAKVKDHFDITR